MGVGAAGASAGRALQEVREKPARAAISPRMVAIFIVFSFCYFVLCAEKNLGFFWNQVRLLNCSYRSESVKG